MCMEALFLAQDHKEGRIYIECEGGRKRKTGRNGILKAGKKHEDVSERPGDEREIETETA